MDFVPPDLDFVPPDLDFVPPDFDFVPTGFDFVPPDFEFLPRVLEVGNRRRVDPLRRCGVAKLQNMAPNDLKSPVRRQKRAVEKRLLAAPA